MRFSDKKEIVDNIKIAYDYLMSKGFEPHIISGILGNFMVESSPNLKVNAYNPNDVGKPAFGLAQWRGDRLDRLKEYAGEDINSLETQLDYMVWELNNTEKRALEKLKTATTAKDAALLFSKYYERPSSNPKLNHNDKRANYAETIYSSITPIKKEGSEEQVMAYQKEFDKVSSLVAQEYDFKVKDEREEVSAVKDKLDTASKEVAFKKELTDIFSGVKPIQESEPQPQRYTSELNPQELLPQENEFLSFFLNPKMQGGGEVYFDYVDYGTKEYEQAYKEGRLANFANPLDEVVITVDKKTGKNISTNFNPKAINLMDNPLAGVIKSKNAISDQRNISKEGESTSIKTQDYKINNKDLPEVDSGIKEDVNGFIREIQSQLPEITLTYSKEASKIKKTIEEKEEGLSPVKEQPIDLINAKSKEDVKAIQNKLKEKGYNLNPYGRFKNDGVDGIAGLVTQKAIEEYNSSLNKGSYQTIKEGTGFLGGCTETQCTEYVQNEIFRNLKPDVSRKEWNEKTGLYGDAWRIGKNILNSGGKQIDFNEVQPGDVITIYTGGGSEYQDKADKEGSGTTHSAVVDQVNPDGSYYILHNVHEGNQKEGYKGREYRNKVTPEGGVEGWWKFQVKEAYRPNIEGVQDNSKPLREDITLEINPNKKDLLKEGNTLTGTKESKIKQYLEPLNKLKTKEKVSKIYDIDEEEYQSLAKIAIGIIGQEADFGTNLMAYVKPTVAKTARLVGAKDDEVSKGVGRFKYRTNFGDADLTAFGINDKNFTDRDKMPITIINKLATDYKRFIKKGYSKEDAMYRAVVVYNSSLSGISQGKSREEWAKDYDVDYANKVLNYANLIDVKSKDKNYKTTVDRLLLKDNVLKWASTLKSRGNI